MPSHSAPSPATIAAVAAPKVGISPATPVAIPKAPPTAIVVSFPISAGPQRCFDGSSGPFGSTFALMTVTGPGVVGEGSLIDSPVCGVGGLNAKARAAAGASVGLDVLIVQFGGTSLVRGGVGGRVFVESLRIRCEVGDF